MLLYFTEDYCSINNRKEMIHMTKEKYLAKLRQQLLFRLSNSEIDEIVSDMEECFEAGAAEGKSEEEICLSLGEPKSAAASLLNEQPAGERVKTFSETWLPMIISAVLFAFYTYCGFEVDIDTYGYVLPIMYVLPLIMWVLFERKSFWGALADYKCDFFTFFGSLCMIAASAACDQIPKRMLIKGHAAPNLQLYVILTVVFVSAAMILLSVSLWKNAPKFFAAAPLIAIACIAYNGVWLCSSYSNWNNNRDAIWDVGGIGVGFRNIMTTVFVCAAAFLLWSFIHRNALTLASAYAAMAVTGFMFYWYYILATMDPTANNSLAVLFLKTTSGKNYVIWGSIIAAAVLVLTIISKLAKRKKVG